MTPIFNIMTCYFVLIDLFTDTAAIVEFIRFKEYYGMSRGHSLSIYAVVLGKMRTDNDCLSAKMQPAQDGGFVEPALARLYYLATKTAMLRKLAKMRSLLHPNTAQRSFFSITIFFQEDLKKNLPRKGHVNTDPSTSDRAHAP